MTVVDVCVEAVISDNFAANVCVVLVVTILVARPAVIIALVYDLSSLYLMTKPFELLQLGLVFQLQQIYIYI